MCDALETADNCPADCGDWQLASYNYQTLCDDIETLHIPSSVDEVKQLVSAAAAAGKRVKVTGKAHSATDVMCTDGVLISTHDKSCMPARRLLSSSACVWATAC